MRVLLVEDNPGDARLIEENLREAGSFSITHVPSLAQAAAAIAEATFDVVLLDLSLPDSQGLDGLRRLREVADFLPIVVMTGLEDDELAERAVASGAQDYLLKGSAPPRVLARSLRYAVARARDLAQRVAAEQALVESQARYREIAANFPGVVFQLRRRPDGEFQFLFLSEGARTFLGEQPLDPPTASWEHVLARVVSEDRERILAELSESARTLTPWQSEFRMESLDGSRRWLRGGANPSVLAGGDVLWEGAFLNITRTKELEVRLGLSQRLEAVGKLAGGIAHDFNNLLTILTGRAQLLLRRVGPDDPLREGLETIRSACERGAALTKQLLAFSRKQVLQPIALSLNDVAQAMEPMLASLLTEAVELRLDLDGDLGAVRVDPVQIEQVLMNLVVNARDAMPNGGRVSIETRNVLLDDGYAASHVAVTPGPYVLLAVSDTGTGMDERTASQVFEPFFTTKEKGKGTGLGLSTAYGIVKQSGGNIWLYSEPGVGTTFKVYLPRCDDQAERSQRSQVAPGRELGGSETILLVEDELDLLDVAREILTAQGYNVLTAASAGEALEKSRALGASIDLLVTDVVMPKMSGPELAKRLQREVPRMRVLFMSGYTDRGIVSRGVLTPGTRFIEKPFTHESLARAVYEALHGETGSS